MINTEISEVTRIDIVRFPLDPYTAVYINQEIYATQYTGWDLSWATNRSGLLQEALVRHDGTGKDLQYVKENGWPTKLTKLPSFKELTVDG